MEPCLHKSVSKPLRRFDLSHVFEYVIIQQEPSTPNKSLMYLLKYANSDTASLKRPDLTRILELK